MKSLVEIYDIMPLGFLLSSPCSSEMYNNIYLDLRVLLSVHFNQGVLARVRHKTHPITPIVLCFVFKLLLKVLDSILKLIKAVQFALSHLSLNSD